MVVAIVSPDGSNRPRHSQVASIEPQFPFRDDPGSCGRADVLVCPEQVVRIVLRLHMPKAVVVSAIRGTDPVRSLLFREEVHVDAAGGERLERLPAFSGPSDVRFRGTLLPRRGRAADVAGISVADRAIVVGAPPQAVAEVENQ